MLQNGILSLLLVVMGLLLLYAYRSQAQAFASELGREHYRHFAGLQEAYAIEAIYDRHAALFDPTITTATR